MFGKKIQSHFQIIYLKFQGSVWQYRVIITGKKFSFCYQYIMILLVFNFISLSTKKYDAADRKIKFAPSL